MKCFKQFLLESADIKNNPNFWKWFGNSKVVDESGNPLTCYHGTASLDIKEFLPKDSNNEISQSVLDFYRKAKINNERFGYMNFRGGTFFSPQPDYANHYTGENKGIVYAVYIKAENPVYVDMVTKKAWGVDPHKTPDALILVIEDIINEIAVIDPTQIKSAIGNNGDFDPNNPDITK